MKVKKISQKQEKTIANKFDGTVRPGSGMFDNTKGDVITKDFLIEAKYTSSPFYQITFQVWDKINKESQKELKYPMLYVSVDHSNFIAGENYVCIDLELYNDMVSAVKNTLVASYFEGKENNKVEKGGGNFTVFLDNRKKSRVEYHLVCLRYEDFIPIYKVFVDKMNKKRYNVCS